MNDSQIFTLNVAKKKEHIIKVLGVGGGGSNAINYMYEHGIKGVDFVICNTDAQALEGSAVPNKIQLGKSISEGLGAGANPEIGEKAAVESLEDVRTVLENTKMVFITAGMGGGTGTGAAPIIAKLAREMDVLTIGIVTVPFSFEGKARNEQAQKGIENLRKHVDSLIIINNNKLREIYGNLGFKLGFAKADEVLLKAAQGIAEVITHHYKQNIDLRDAKTVLSNSGTAIMGSATASGKDRAREVIIKALESPLLNDNKILGTKNVLLLIVSGTTEVTIDEITEINEYIQEESGNNANIIMGIGEDNELGEGISVTVIATGFGSEQQYSISNLEPQKVIYALESDQKITRSFVIEPSQNKTFDFFQTNKNVVKKTEAEAMAAPENDKFASREPVSAEALNGFIITDTKPQRKDEASSNANQEPPKSVFHFDVNSYKKNTEEPPKTQVFNLDDSKPKESKPDDNMGFVLQKKDSVSANNTAPAGDISKKLNITAPLEDSFLTKMTSQRQGTIDFAKRYNTSYLEEMERIPAYRRVGVELSRNKPEDTPIRSQVSITTDVNNNIQLRTNNSFLHDNVD